MDLIPHQKTVAFEMDTRHMLVKGTAACDYSYLYQSVMGKGTMEILDDSNTKIHGLQKILSHYTDAAELEFRQEILDIVSVLKLTVTEWSCKEHQGKR